MKEPVAADADTFVGAFERTRCAHEVRFKPAQRFPRFDVHGAVLKAPATRTP